MLDGVGSPLGNFSYPPTDTVIEIPSMLRGQLHMMRIRQVFFRCGIGQGSIRGGWVRTDYVQQISSIKIGVRMLNTECRHAGLNKSVLLNSSATVDLAVASIWYLGQLRIDLDLGIGRDANYRSEIFKVDHNPSQAPLTWPGKASSQVSLSPNQSITAVPTPSSSQPSSHPSQPSSSLLSQPSSTPSSPKQAFGLGNGAIAGISVGSTLVSSVLILTAILLVLRSRRRRRSQASKSGMLKPVQFPTKLTPSSSSAPTELAGQEEQWRELSNQTAVRELPATDGDSARGGLSGHTIR